MAGIIQRAPDDLTLTKPRPKPLVQLQDSLTMMFRTIGGLFSSRSDISPTHMSSAVGIGNIYYKMLSDPKYGWLMAIWFSVLLNVNLAILNMLPFPVLDGGHITIALMEAVRRRPVNVRVLEYIQVVCVVALMGFMLFVTFFDTTDIFGDNKKVEAPPKPSFRGVEKMEPAAEVSAGTLGSMPDSSSLPLSYCADPYQYQRRNSRVVSVGGIDIGGDNPIRVQSMITSDTRDTAACVEEMLGLGRGRLRDRADHGADARSTPRTWRTSPARCGRAGCDGAAGGGHPFQARCRDGGGEVGGEGAGQPGQLRRQEEVRDPGVPDEQYDEELERIREQFVAAGASCARSAAVAMRIGTNHGSLSDRIMNRYGDTPLGMVESALEFARIARDDGYHDFVFSMKASNPKVMIEAYRLLVARLDAGGC